MFTGFLERRFIDPLRRMKTSQFEELTLKGGEIVFLGDSITEGGAWSEWFPGLHVVNRGIGGDTTDGVLARLDTAIQQPSKVFLLIGTNDLAFRRPIAAVLENAAFIVGGIRSLAPDAKLVVQSVMPRALKYRSRIELLNERYRALAEEHDATYLDLWPVLSDGRGALKSDFSLDELHLNGAGYRAWVGELESYVRR